MLTPRPGGERPTGLPPLPPGHLCFRLGCLHHPSPLPCRVPPSGPLSLPHRPSNHESFRTAQSLAQGAEGNSQLFSGAYSLSQPSPLTPASVLAAPVLGARPTHTQSTGGPWRPGYYPVPRLPAETADSPTPYPTPRESRLLRTWLCSHLPSPGRGVAICPGIPPLGCHADCVCVK